MTLWDLTQLDTGFECEDEWVAWRLISYPMLPFYLLKTHLSTFQWQTRQPKHIETLHITHESISEAASYPHSHSG